MINITLGLLQSLASFHQSLASFHFTINSSFQGKYACSEDIIGKISLVCWFYCKTRSIALNIDTHQCRANKMPIT